MLVILHPHPLCLINKLWPEQEMGERSPLCPWACPQQGNLCPECGSSILQINNGPEQKPTTLSDALSKKLLQYVPTQEKNLIFTCTAYLYTVLDG